MAFRGQGKAVPGPLKANVVLAARCTVILKRFSRKDFRLLFFSFFFLDKNIKKKIQIFYVAKWKKISKKIPEKVPKRYTKKSGFFSDFFRWT